MRIFQSSKKILYTGLTIPPELDSSSGLETFWPIKQAWTCMELAVMILMLKKSYLRDMANTCLIISNFTNRMLKISRKDITSNLMILIQEIDNSIPVTF